MDWWQRILPLAADSDAVELSYQNASCSIAPAARAATGDECLLVRPRLSRIFYLRRFFDYPVKLNANTIRNLGLPRMARIGASYAKAQLAPCRPEVTLEDFFVNRFGRELYLHLLPATTRRRSGACPAARSAPSGARSGSRASPSPAPCATRCGAMVQRRWTAFARRTPRPA